MCRLILSTVLLFFIAHQTVAAVQLDDDSEKIFFRRPEDTTREEPPSNLRKDWFRRHDKLGSITFIDDSNDNRRPNGKPHHKLPGHPHHNANTNPYQGPEGKPGPEGRPPGHLGKPWPNENNNWNEKPIEKNPISSEGHKRPNNGQLVLGNYPNSENWGVSHQESNSSGNTFTVPDVVSNNNNNKGSSNRRLLPDDSCGMDLPRRILGGTKADIDEYPWMALLQYRDRTGKISHDCSGALISTRYVLTAAHCTIGLGVTTRKMQLTKVRLGEWDLASERDCQQEICSNPYQDIEIENVVNHEKYNPREKAQTNDIALIRLKEMAELNQFVQPICLPMNNVGKENIEGKRMSVSGWGRTANVKNSNSNVKMKVDVPVVSWESCRNFYESFYSDVKIDRSQMCAGGEDGRDTCQGDSGGPLMTTGKIGDEFRWFVVGIVSSGPAACGVEGRPSLYTKVAEFTDWVLTNMRE